MTNSLYHFELSPMPEDPTRNRPSEKRKNNHFVNDYLRCQQSEENEREQSIDLNLNNEEIYGGPEEIQLNHDVSSGFTLIKLLSD